MFANGYSVEIILDIIVWCESHKYLPNYSSFFFLSSNWAQFLILRLIFDVGIINLLHWKNKKPKFFCLISFLSLCLIRTKAIKYKLYIYIWMCANTCMCCVYRILFMYRFRSTNNIMYTLCYAAINHDHLSFISITFNCQIINYFEFISQIQWLYGAIDNGFINICNC